MIEPKPLYRRTFDARTLSTGYPPRFTLPHKQHIFAEHCPDGCQTHGSLEVSRWSTAPLADRSGNERTVVTTQPGGYAYAPPGDGHTEWYVNFAATHLFAFYADRCFAQDEIQVFEHPVLGSVREALIDAGLSTLVTDHCAPTPFLIRGAHRRMKVTTRPQAGVAWTRGLYGRQFSRAPLEAARAGVSPVNPPTVSNILVIEAPRGFADYQPDEIDLALQAAFTGFRAARLDSPDCTIHTGFWGCGAYGGNHVLMTAVQLIAAQLAGVPRLNYHTWDRAGAHRYAEGEQVARDTMRICPPEADRIVEHLLSLGFQWGSNDGN